MCSFVRVVLVGFLFSTGCEKSGATLSATDAKEKVQRGALLVDVRTPEEFAAGHIEGAINIPVDDLEVRKGELKPDSEIVLCCRSGARSGRAESFLRAAGFSKVYNLGGMSNWK